MENSSRYFENLACQYYPCHPQPHINCLFCYCPFYSWEKCPGNPQYIFNIKDCTNCVYPHQPDNYDNIINKIACKGKE